VNDFDLLGADDTFADQYITVRVKKIDRDRLRYAIGGSKGDIATSALTIVNTAPKAFLDLFAPVAKNKLTEFGIDADISVSKAPIAKTARAMSEFWPGLLAGTVLGATGWLIYRGVAALVRR
jgi:hypothetical protein